MKNVTTFALITSAFVFFNQIDSAQRVSAKTHSPLLQGSKNNKLVTIRPIVAKNIKAEKAAHERVQKPLKLKEIEAIEFK